MLQCSIHLQIRDREEQGKRCHPMFILSVIILSGLVAAQLTARLALSHFEEFRDLPHLHQEG